MVNQLSTKDIRDIFARKYQNKEIVRNDTGSLSGADTIEIVGASFIADEASIFGKVDHEYISRELAWYTSKSLNVYDITGDVPAIWKAVATPDGYINSNYGYLIFSSENQSQFENALLKLLESSETRQAVMVYTRPSIHTDWNRMGMKDFICTNAVQYLIRDNKLDVIVQMRSNDARFGYPNDRAWQRFVQLQMLDRYNLEVGTSLELGNIYWQVGSLHVYEKHFYMIDHYIKTGEITMERSHYKEHYAKA